MPTELISSYSYEITFIGFASFFTLLLLIMMSQLNSSLGSRTEINLMRALIITCFLSPLSEAVDMAARSEFLPYPLWLNWAMNGLDLLATTTICFIWFRLIEYKSSRRFFSSGLPLILSFIPFIANFLLNLASFQGGFTFYIADDGTYVRGSFYIFQVIFCYTYFFIATGICFYGFFHGSVIEKNLFKELFVYSLFPIIGGIFQVAVGIIPFSSAGMFISIFYLFLRLQNQRINSDAMTGLNNKLHSQQYVERMIRTADEQPFLLFMMDVNHFKQVNDTYGHLAGDKALLIVADALRKTIHTTGGFIGRFGGDEFTAIIPKHAFPIPSSLQGMLNAKIATLAKDRKLGFNFTISVGWAICHKTDETVSSVTARADEMLYEVKKSR